MNRTCDGTLSNSLAEAATPTEKTDVLFQYMERRGQSFYDETVTQLEHGLQAAHLARCNRGLPVQVVAALLHDIGHFVMDEHDQQSSFLVDDWLHEDVGARILEQFFVEAVTEPIRLHVPAKRYLCTIDSSYFNSLSQASKRSFQIQGGMMSAEEVAEFERNPYHIPATLLRRWDDGAKVKGLQVPGLEEYRREIESCFRRLG